MPLEAGPLEPLCSVGVACVANAFLIGSRDRVTKYRESAVLLPERADTSADTLTGFGETAFIGCLSRMPERDSHERTKHKRHQNRQDIAVMKHTAPPNTRRQQHDPPVPALPTSAATGGSHG